MLVSRWKKNKDDCLPSPAVLLINSVCETNALKGKKDKATTSIVCKWFPIFNQHQIFILLRKTKERPKKNNPKFPSSFCKKASKSKWFVVCCINTKLINRDRTFNERSRGITKNKLTKINEKFPLTSACDSHNDQMKNSFCASLSYFPSKFHM